MARARINLRVGRSYDRGDQGAFAHLYRSLAWGQTRAPQIGLLPCETFSSGRDLPRMREGVDGRVRIAGAPELVSFHMTWASRSHVKRECLEASGQWLARGPPVVCAAFAFPGAIQVERNGPSDLIRGCQVVPSITRTPRAASPALRSSAV